ncbi:MAG: ACT domain-containing protein [Desulfobacterales bacterium]|nr:ACT domain-containing protein [Desulfobacterales bacterium]
MESEKELVFITVIGKDRKGVVATVSSYLYQKAVNIVDINQRIMTDGYFVMSMMVDVADMPIPMEEMGRDLEAIGQDLAMQIQVQHENLFKMMHRI